MSSSEGSSTGTSTSNRRRRKRKDGRNLKAEEEPEMSAPAAPEIVEEEAERVVEPTTSASPSAAEPAKKSSEVVTMEVRDVRDILSGKPAPSASAGDATEVDDDDDDDEELADDEEWEYYYEDEDGNEVEPPAEGSLEQLLADAKKLRGDDESEKSGNGTLEGVSIPGGFKGAISTIVTIDFFFVLGLLAWFLAGIFVRAAFGNDAVQIAFNNNFELIVQPALGVLMIASAAGALFKEPEEDDRGLS